MKAWLYIILGVTAVVLVATQGQDLVTPKSPDQALASGQDASGDCAEVGQREFEKARVGNGHVATVTVNLCAGSNFQGHMPRETFYVVHKRRRGEPDARVYVNSALCPVDPRFFDEYDVKACRGRNGKFIIEVASSYAAVDRWPAGIRLETQRR